MASIAVRELGEADLDRLVAAGTAFDPAGGWTTEGLVDWRRQAEAMAWLVAEAGEAPIGGAVVLVGWHNPRHIAMSRLGVRPEHRRRGAGSELLAHAAEWAQAHDATELDAEVPEEDADSLAWAERRGFHEVGRDSLMVLALEEIEAPDPSPPEGIQLVTWAERPDLIRGIYEVAREATVDIPGNEGDDIGTFEEWLARDMQGHSDRPEATFVALAGDEVVGFAKLSIGSDRERGFHDLTGVRRDWRGRGIAAALKRCQIAWAKTSGYSRLETFNEERNEPIRRLNARHGYRLQPGRITVRGPIPVATSPG